MRRLYFLLPNIEITRTVVDELLLRRIDYQHIHILAREGTSMHDLPEASLFEKSDFIPAIERGLALGGATGVIAGIAAMTFSPAGLELGGGAVLAISLAGAGFGAWVSGMIGVAVPNSQIARFNSAIESGEILIMIDVPKLLVKEIEHVVHEHHPKAEMGGTEPHIPAFP